MKGIILAGGSGTRLYPITEGISKQLMPIYDKTMIYYPLSTLMTAKIQDILVITTPQDQEVFIRLLGDGSKFGVNLNYVTQPSPDGLAQAFLLGQNFIGQNPCTMILGDNLYFGNDFDKFLLSAKENAFQSFATNFGYAVKDPERFGIMELDKSQNIISVEEKPKHPKSKYAITGLYFYPDDVVSKAKLVKKSPRGELEITTLNDMYLQEGRLKAQVLGDGFTWFDTGTPDSQLEAANMIKTIQSNKGTIICAPEIIGYHNGWLSREDLITRGELLHKNDYGKCLIKVAKE